MSIADLIWPFLFPLAALVIAFVHSRWKQFRGTDALETFLMWQIVIGLGLGYLYAGMGHLLAPDRVAESIGWPAGNPFQREVGIWDAAMGIVAILCLKFRNTGYWTATVLGIGIFSVSAGLGHGYEMLAHGDYSWNNAGPVMYIDLFYPLILIAMLYLLVRMKNQSETGR